MTSLIPILPTLLGALGTAIGVTLAAWFLARVRPGRFQRTLDHATKLLEFAERHAARRQSATALAEPGKTELDALLSDVLKAVREDFVMERTQLEEFRSRTIALRGALLLQFPTQSWLYLPFLIYHTTLLFMTYAVIFRIWQHNLEPSDFLPLAVALAIVGAMRFIIWLFAKHVHPGTGTFSRDSERGEL